MASPDVDSSVALSGHRSSITGRSLSRTRDILIETMQLVEPRQESKVPNHLLESSMFITLLDLILFGQCHDMISTYQVGSITFIIV